MTGGQNMRPTEILSSEHKVIKKMLKITSEVCERISSNEKVDPEHLKDIVVFFKGFADACHHGKEEEILFKELTDSGFPKEGGPVGAMLAEHIMGRKLIAEMASAAEDYGSGTESAGVRFLQNAEQYVGLLSDHIYKEDNILFAMADQRLTSEQQDKILQRFKSFEHDDMGVGTHEEFLKLVARLEQEYLKQKTT